MIESRNIEKNIRHASFPSKDLQYKKYPGQTMIELIMSPPIIHQFSSKVG